MNPALSALFTIHYSLFPGQTPVRALVIDHSIKLRIAKLIAFAEANVFDAGSFCAGDDPRWCLTIPVGFRVVYSHERFPKSGEVRRFSVSVRTTKAGMIPHVAAIDELLHLFGLADGLHQIDDFTFEHIGRRTAVLCAHLVDRHLAEVLETQGKLPNKQLREQKLREAGLFYESLHESRHRVPASSAKSEDSPESPENDSPESPDDPDSTL